ncbi:MAG: hypothetical protein V4623_03385 [Pseudomonadota bacterium]
MAEQARFLIEAKSNFTPFWRRLPQFFRYPMQPGSLLRIAGYSLLAGISMLLPELFALLLRSLLWLVFLKYAFVVMERTANGQFDLADGVREEGNGDLAQVARQFGFFILLGLFCGFSLVFLGKLGALSLLLCGVAIPAGIMIIAVTRSLWQALNPKQIWFFCKTIGSPYLALCFLLFSVAIASGSLQSFVSRQLGESWLIWPLLSFVEFYFTLIMYHMMGYAIYQYHEDLGVEATVSFSEAEAHLAPGGAQDAVLAKLGTLVANGQATEALELLRSELRSRWESNELHQRYQKLLLAEGQQAEALTHAREFIAKLTREKRLFQALDLCEQSLLLDPEFQLQDAKQVYELAAAAYQAKRLKLALDLMRRFDRRYLGHSHVPLVYLLSAKILSEHYKMDKQALHILDGLQRKFPEHEVAEEARNYAAALMRIAALA